MDRLSEELSNVDKLYSETKKDEYLHKQYCLEHFFEISSSTYEEIVKYCIDNEVEGVVDIGCAYGYQSELFLVNDINYIGIDESSDYFWNSEKFTYYKVKYPCDMKKYNNYLAISSLCISWNCYLHEGEKTLNDQFYQLSNDFRRCLIYGSPENMMVAKKYFSEVNNIKRKFYELIK